MSNSGNAPWGNYPKLSQRAEPCHWRSDLPATLNKLSAGTTLAYGNGRSYGDVCLAASGTALATGNMDRWISADWNTGVVVAESGMLLAEVLRQAIPRGWFLAVAPGTQQVTLGGAVANDVHGKNHHLRGTFGRHVLAFELLRSEGGLMHCSATQNQPLFNATIGGLGLTGIISWVSIQLVPLRSSMIESRTEPFNSLAEFFQLSAELDTQYEYTAAWLDCKSPSGQGVFTAGRHSLEGPLRADDTVRWSVPVTPPISAINRASVRLLNKGWYWLHRKKTQTTASYRPFLFPLDGISHWNRLYGRSGFQQYQCVLPDSNAAPALQEILEQIAISGTGSFLSVLKKCGDVRSPGLLSFPMPGTSLALDFPQGQGLSALFRTLDRVVAEAGGRLYAAKDAHMSALDFQRAYPAWQQLEALRDPVLCSHFWRRVSASVQENP